MTVKEHYDNHLGKYYSWMAGDFTEKRVEHQQNSRQVKHVWILKINN
jgi:hypothetical protein